MVGSSIQQSGLLHVLRRGKGSQQTDTMDQELPRRPTASAAVIPPITDAKADVRRGRDGPEADILSSCNPRVDLRECRSI